MTLQIGDGLVAALRKNFLHITPAIENSNELRHAISYAIEDKVGAGRKRTKPSPYLVSQASCVRMFFEYLTTSRNAPHDTVGGLRSCRTRILLPDTDKIGLRLRRP
jgi:hypothetical protein